MAEELEGDPFKEFGGSSISEEKDPFAEFGGRGSKKKIKSDTGGQSSNLGSNPFGASPQRAPFDFARQSNPQLVQDIQEQELNKQLAQSARLNKINQVYDSAQGESISKARKNAPVDNGEIKQGVEDKDRKGNRASYLYNELLNGVGSIAAGLGDVGATLMAYSPNQGYSYNENQPTPRTEQEINDQQSILTDYRANTAPKVRDFFTKNVGSEVDKGLQRKYQDETFTAALGGLARSAPAIAATVASGGVGTGALFLQSYDSALESIDQSEAGRNLDDATKTFYAGSVGLVVSALEKYGLDKILKSETGVIGNMIANQAIKNASRETGGKVTGDVLTRFLDKEVLNLSNKYLKAGIRGLDGALVEYTTEAAQEGATAGAELLTNQATGKPVFDTSETSNWKGFLSRVNKAGVMGAIGGGLLGGVAGIARLNKADVDQMQQTLSEVNEALSNENLSETSQKALVEQKIKLEDEMDATAQKVDKAFDRLDDTQKERVLDITDRKAEIESVVNDENVPESVKTALQEENKVLDEELSTIGENDVVTPVKKASDVKTGDTIELVNGNRVPVTNVEGNMVTMTMPDGSTFSATPELVEMSVVKPKEAPQETISPESAIEPIYTNEASLDENIVNFKNNKNTKKISFNDAIDIVLKNPDLNEIQRTTADKFKTILRDANVFHHPDYSFNGGSDLVGSGQDYGATIDYNNGDVLIFKKGNFDYHSLMHEAVHVLSFRALNEGFPEYNVDFKNKIQKYFDKAKENIGDKKEYKYAFSNLDEFLAESFGNSDFQAELSYIDSDSNQKTNLFKEIINSIKKLVKDLYDFDIPNSLLEDVLAATESIIKKPNEEQAPTQEVVTENVSEKRTKEVLDKANTDLEALKQVSNKPAKYKASVKRLNDAFKAGEISEQEFNDTKARFDDVIAESSPNVPKKASLTKEEITSLDNELANQDLTTDDFIQYERARAIEDASNDAEVVQPTGNDNGASTSETTGSQEAQGKGKVAEIQERRQSIKDRISQKLKEQRGQVNSGFDLSLLSDFIELGSTYIEEGIVKASDFIKRFRQDYKELGFDDITITDEDIQGIYDQVSQPEQSIESDIQEIGLTKEDVANLRAELGQQQFAYEVKSNAERIREAKSLIKQGYNIKDLVKKVEGDYLPSAIEVEVLKQYYSGLTNEINKNPTPENIKMRDDLLKAIDVVKVSQGRSIQAWDGLTQLEDNLANFLTEESKYNVLTPKEISELTDKYNKAKEALDKYKAKQQQAANKAKNKKAQEEINKLKTSPNRAVVKEGFKAERKKFVEDFRAELRKIRTTPSAVILPYQRELIALAPFVRKMVQSYVNEGIYDLKQITKGIHEEFVQDVPELTEEDVRDIIAGEHRNPTNTKNYKLAQIRDLQRQAKLEREIDLLEQGIVESKNPAQKKQKSDRVAELEAEIKEIKKRNPNLFAPQVIEEAERRAKENIAELEKRLADNDLSFKEVVRPSSEQLNAYRAQQKQLRAELESRRKEAELGRYSEESKLEAKKSWFTGQIEKLKQEIANGNYDPIEEPIPVLLDQEALRLKDEYMKFKEETRTRRDNAEFQASSRMNKALSKLRQVVELRRLVQTSIDLSIPLRQGISVMLNPRTSNIGYDAYMKMLKAVKAKDNYNQMMFDIEQSDQFLESKDDGIVYAEIGSGNNEQRDEHHRQSFLYDIPFVRVPFMASERAASAWQNYARYNLYLRGVKMLEAQGKTRQNAKQAYEQMAARVMVDTGRGKILGIKDKNASTTDSNIKAVLGNTLYGARLASAIFRKLNPFYYLNPKVDSSVRVQAFKDMAGYTSGLLITGLTLSALGYSVSFDADDPDFLKARKGKKVLDFTGGQSTYVRTYLRLIRAVYKRIDPDVSHEDANKYASFAGQSVKTFFRNKLAPNTSYFVNMFAGENTIGEKFDPMEILYLWPMYGDDIYKSVKEGHPMDLAVIIPVAVSGLGYMEYEKDIRRAKLNRYLDSDKDKKIVRFLKDNQLNLMSDINQEIYDIATGGKTRLTKAQSDRYEELWAQYIKDELNEAGELSKLSKLSEEKRKKELNKIKLDANKYAKAEVSGLPEGVTVIRDDDKTYQLTPEQVKERIKINREYITDYGEELRRDFTERFIEEGMSKVQAERKALIELNKKANAYSKIVMLEAEKERNDGKVKFKEKTE